MVIPLPLDYIAEQLRPLAIDLTSLVVDPANARIHPPNNITALSASLRVYGQRKPVVVNRRNMVIEAGNGTYEAAKALGWSHIAAVMVDDDSMTATGFAIADNRTAELAEWDKETLGRLLGELDDVDEELQGMVDELAAAVGIEEPPGKADAEPQIDKAAELQGKWGTEAGQLWLIGEHRLLCGDSTKREDVERVMGGEKATCVFTDPPYGVSVGAKNRLLNSVQKAGCCLTDMASDDMKPEELEATLLPSFINTRETAMAEDCTVFMTAPQGGELGMMMMMMQKAGLKIRHVLIWKKNSPTFSMGRLDYDYQHEPILMTWLARHKRPMLGAHKTSVWEIDKPRACDVHPTMKPVELYVNGYLNNSDRGDVVYEPYAGSGTAFVAAQNTERKCRSIEISPAYCAVILERMAIAFPLLKIRQI